MGVTSFINSFINYACVFSCECVFCACERALVTSLRNSCIECERSEYFVEAY